MAEQPHRIGSTTPTGSVDGRSPVARTTVTRNAVTRNAVTLAVAAMLTLTGCQTGTDDGQGSTAGATSTDVTGSSTPTPSAAESLEPTATPGQGTTTITAPADGATLTGPNVTVSGTGTAFEATLLYVVHDAGGNAVREGFTTAGANGEIGPFTFDLTLDPGTYTVRVWEAGMEEGDASAPPLNLAEVTFTVG